VKRKGDNEDYLWRNLRFPLLFVAGLLLHLSATWVLGSGICGSDQKVIPEPIVLDNGKRAIHQVAFSPDGTLLLSTSSDNTAVLWNLEKRKKQAVFEHDGMCWTAALSPDGKMIAAGTTQWIARPGPFTSITFMPSAAVKLWDVDAGKELVVLTTGRVLTNPANCIAFSPDGKTVALGSFGPRHEGGEVVLWSVEKKTLTETYSVPSGAVSALAYSADGKLLAAASADAHGTGAVTVWDAQTGKAKLKITKDTCPLLCAAISRDGKTLAFGGGMQEDETRKHPKVVELTLWDLVKDKKLGSFSDIAEPVRSVAFSPDGKLLASAGGDSEGELIVWDVGAQKKVWRMKQDDWVTSVSFSRDGESIACGAYDGKIRIWEVAKLAKAKP
jgi:WD40 repeat protein